MTDIPESPTRETVVVERGGSGTTGLLLGLVLLVIVAVGAYFVIERNNSATVRDAAITDAAKSVGDTAERAGDAIDGEKK